MVDIRNQTFKETVVFRIFTVNFLGSWRREDLMTQVGSEMGGMFMLVVLIGTVVVAQSPPPLSTVNCLNTIFSLAPCLNFISGNTSSPSSSCCSQLATVIRSRPECLCTILDGGGAALALGIAINQTKALLMPAACNVQTPPISSCNALLPPTAAPEPTPKSPTATTPTSSGVSENNVSKSTPSITSGVSSIRISMAFYLLLIGSCAFVLFSY